MNPITLPILYSFRRCPYAMRARMAIFASGVSVELREVLLKAKPPSMLEYSPKATVPVLVTTRGDVIEQSMDIMQWALKQNDPLNWREQMTPEMYELVEINDGPFKQALDHYKYSDRFPEKTPEIYQAEALAYLHNLEIRLRERPFLAGAKPSLVDIALFPFIRQFAFVDKAWFDQCPLPRLHSWLNYFLKSQLFESIMHKHPAWQEGTIGVKTRSTQSAQDLL